MYLLCLYIILTLELIYSYSVFYSFLLEAILWSIYLNYLSSWQWYELKTSNITKSVWIVHTYNIITVIFISVNRSQKMHADLKQKWLVFVFICSVVNRLYDGKYTQDSSTFLQSLTLLSHSLLIHYCICNSE